jgi:hypothetical protein
MFIKLNFGWCIEWNRAGTLTVKKFFGERRMRGFHEDRAPPVSGEATIRAAALGQISLLEAPG